MTTRRRLPHEPIVVILPGDHPLARRSQIDPADLTRATFIGYSDTPHVLRGIVERYFREHQLAVSPSHFLDGFATGISLVASTRGFTLLPAYVEALLPRSVVSRPLAGTPPTIEVAACYRADNPSPVLLSFLENIDRLIDSQTGGNGQAFQLGGS